jgi:hypothetical protein
MPFVQLLSETVPTIDQFTNLSMAGLMGAMWLWERRTSRQREQQIDESHARIMSDRIQLDQLMDVVQQNTEAMTKLAAMISSSGVSVPPAR